jgi:hypothetical protein
VPALPALAHDELKTRTLPQGISERHSRLCGSLTTGPCDCTPSYRAFVFDRRIHTKVRKTFATLKEAKAWRAAATTHVNEGRQITRSRMTLRDAAEAWLAGAEADPPTVLTRSGQPYKPSVLRGYRHDLEQHILRDLGAVRLSDVRRGDHYIWSILQKKHFDEALAHTAAQADYRAVRIWGAVFLAGGLVLGTWGNLLG